MCSYEYDSEAGSHYCFECQECRKLDISLQAIEDAMKHLVKQLYTMEPLNVTELHECVADICEEINIEVPDGLPLVRRSRCELFEFASELVRQQQAQNT